MEDLPSKPEWIIQVRNFANRALPEAYDEAVFVLSAVTTYEDTDELGGQSCTRVLRHLGNLKIALGLKELPGHIETHGWSFATF